jgi:6-phosphogluconolactonase (cycloisomerase 2 family)
VSPNRFAEGGSAAVASGLAEGGSAVSPDNRFAVTANYGGGSLSVFPIEADGRLGDLSQLIAFAGHGTDSVRQASPHLHCVLFSPDGRYLFAADLGTDRLYRLEVGKGAGEYLRRESLRSFDVASGTGARHFVFHPSGNFLYLLGELGGTVTVFAYKDGELKFQQCVIADSYQVQGSADIRLTPDGRFLYASNRVEGDGLAIYAVNPMQGTLTRVGFQATGKHPRNFILSPDGRFLLVANRDSNQIQVFSIDAASGLLSDTHQDIRVSMPVCLQFID